MKCEPFVGFSRPTAYAHSETPTDPQLAQSEPEFSPKSTVNLVFIFWALEIHTHFYKHSVSNQRRKAGRELGPRTDLLQVLG